MNCVSNESSRLLSRKLECHESKFAEPYLNEEQFINVQKFVFQNSGNAPSSGEGKVTRSRDNVSLSLTPAHVSFDQQGHRHKA